MKRLMTLVVLTMAAIAPGWSVAAGAAAQDRPEAAPSRGDRRGARTLRLARFDLVGDPHKPSVYYVLERAAMGLDTLELRTSFVPEVVRTVDHRPF